MLVVHRRFIVNVLVKNGLYRGYKHACSVSTKGLVLMLYSQTELDLQSHRCIVNKQKSSLSSVQGLIDAVLHNVLHPSNNNFPKTILFDYKFTLSIE